MQTKQTDPSFVVDEEIYELLKKIAKSKDFSTKYKDKAQLRLETLLNCDSLIMCDQQRFGRKAKKQEIDYAERPEKGRRKGKKQQSQKSDNFEDEEMLEEKGEEITSEESAARAESDDDEKSQSEDISKLVRPTSIEPKGKKKLAKKSGRVTIKMAESKKQAIKQT